nr:uncharacterized protein LOC108172942 [Malus domestica]
MWMWLHYCISVFDQTIIYFSFYNGDAEGLALELEISRTLYGLFSSFPALEEGHQCPFASKVSKLTELTSLSSLSQRNHHHHPTNPSGGISITVLGGELRPQVREGDMVLVDGSEALVILIEKEVNNNKCQRCPVSEKVNSHALRHRILHTMLHIFLF